MSSSFTGGAAKLDGIGSMIYHHTKMSAAKIAITIEEDILKEIDRLVRAQVFPNRSKAINTTVRNELGRMKKSRLARECAKLAPAVEQSLAEEGMSGDLEQWPAY